MPPHALASKPGRNSLIVETFGSACERVVQQATKSDRFVTRQGCQTVINALQVQQTIRFVSDDLNR
jgi:hypothetical protein